MNHKLLDGLAAAGIPCSIKPFVPHMTVSHFPNREAAEGARPDVEEAWIDVSFEVTELLVMERRGEAGQFEIAWRIPLLGKAAETDNRLLSLIST